MGIRCWFKALGAVKLFWREICFVRLLCRNKYNLLLLTAATAVSIGCVLPLPCGIICLCLSRHWVSQRDFILAIKKQHYFL